jgi:hypothetical protein
MAQGLAVTEPQPRDPKACEEIAQLLSNVFDITELENDYHSPNQAAQ